VANVSRILPSLRGHEFTADERAAVSRNVERVRSAADWIQHAIETGDVSLDEALAEILKSG
jgi:ferric-dicitrate binding protein FerR (iron transport regulator)